MFNKIRYIAFAILTVWVTNAQSQDFALAKTYHQAGKLAAAKEQIDGFLESDAGNRADAWLLKAVIYAGISNNLQLKYLVPDGKKEAMVAIEKAVKLNKSLVKNELEKDSFAIIRTIYSGYAAEGVALYNTASEKKSATGYAQALDLFRNALIINQLSIEQQWSVNLRPLRPVLQYDAAQAAINANKEDEALLFSRQLADNRVIAAGSYTAADFFNIYQWLTNYYQVKQDAKNLVRYANWGATIYPESQYFTNMLLNGYRQLGDFDHLMPTYERAVKQFPNQSAILYAYSADLFTYIYRQGISEPQKSALATALELRLKQYTVAQPDSSKGHLLLGKFYYNKAVGLQKARVEPERILSVLNKAAHCLQNGIDKSPDRRHPQFKETVLLLVKTLEAANRKGDADTAYKLFGNQ